MLKALILCGGKSTRMGKDKGSLVHNGKTWVQHAMRSAALSKTEVYLSVNHEQLEVYSRLFPTENFILDNFDSIQGPLKGIMSAHKQYPQADWLVLACDMPMISYRTIAALLKNYYSDSQSDFYIYKDKDGFHQPFPGIYSGQALKWVYNFDLIGKLNSHSIKNILEMGTVNYLEVPEGRKDELINFNKEEDLQKLLS